MRHDPEVKSTVDHVASTGGNNYYMDVNFKQLLFMISCLSFCPHCGCVGEVWGGWRCACVDGGGGGGWVCVVCVCVRACGGLGVCVGGGGGLGG